MNSPRVSLSSTAAAVGFVAITSVCPAPAEAACSVTYNSNGTVTNTCPPVPAPVPAPSPAPTPAPAPAPVINNAPVANGGTAQSAAEAKAAAEAQAAAVAQQQQAQLQLQAQQQLQKQTTDVKTGDVKTGDVKTDVKTGDVNVGGSTYKAGSAGAYAPGVYSATGHDCFRNTGGFSAGIQTVAGGVTGGYSGGETYDLVEIETVDKDGKTVTTKVNPCEIARVNLAIIAAGGTPYATDAQMAHAAATAAAASPDAARALSRVMDEKDNLVNRFARKAAPSERVVLQAPAAAPAPANTFNTFIIGADTQSAQKINCVVGTTPKHDAKTKTWTCQPG